MKSKWPLAWVLIILPLLTTFTSCKSKHISIQTPPLKTSLYKTYDIQALTFPGDNSQASLSKDGEWLIYVSQNRPAHKHSQIYLYNFNSKNERRLTYNGGKNYHPVFSKQASLIFYSSTTDIDKENVNDFYKKIIQQPQRSVSALYDYSSYLEIYSSNLSGSNIKRLTHRPSVDRVNDSHPHHKKIIFSSIQANKSKILAYNFMTKQTELVARSQQKISSPSYSPNGKKILWVESDPQKQVSHIYVKPKKTHHGVKLTNRLFQHLYAHWHPQKDYILFSSDRAGKDLDLFVMKSDGSCIRSLAQLPGDQIEARFHPHGNKLVFTSVMNKTRQLYMMKFKAPRCI